MIRQLLPGEALPPGKPRRYTAHHGYVRLRWRVGKAQYVETYEHRVDGDHVTTAEHVHHINHDKSDNRPENLQPISATEHAIEHHRQLDDGLVAARYLGGESIPVISRDLGVYTSSVTKSLQRSGTPTRDMLGENNTSFNRAVDTDEVVRLYLAGRSIQTIADVFGCSNTCIVGRLESRGIKRRRPGRPRVHDLEPISSAVLKVEKVER